ncbi:MAG TPA: anti-sigma factor [Acidimicrobiia bacterium]|nr:anti-sigma factor [Acidimicrobiia bacterium]
MTSEACREYRGTLGAVALGRAEPEESLALRAHIDGCAECRAELRELTAVAAALPFADTTHVAGGLSLPSPALARQVLGRVAVERSARRTRTRRRIAVAAATATAVAAAIIALVLVVPGNGSPPGGQKVVFTTRSGLTANATLRASDAGTQVAFHVSGLHPGGYYWVWLTGEDGDRIAAGTFQGTTQPSDLLMTAALPLSDARRIWVTDDENRVVLDQRLPAPA